MQRLALLALILAVSIPAVTHASYTDEEFRTDIKQYLDQQTMYQQNADYQQQRQRILNDPSNTYTNTTGTVNHSEYDIAQLEDILKKQQELSDKTDQQIQDLLKANEQASNDAASATPLDRQKECEIVVRGSYPSSNGLKCVCPANMEAKLEGDTLYCRDVTVVAPTAQKKSGLDVEALFASFDKDEAGASTTLFEHLKNKYATSSEPVEKVGLIRTVYRSVVQGLMSIFHWAF